MENPDVFDVLSNLELDIQKLIEEKYEVLEALEGIIDIGKRDMSNPKYDGYFNKAKEVIKKYRK